MQSLTIMVKVVIKDCHHMTTMDENVNWIKITHLLLISFIKLKAPFYAFAFTFESLVDFPNVPTR